MDSYEEKVNLTVRQTQEREAKEMMREKAKELRRQWWCMVGTCSSGSSFVGDVATIGSNWRNISVARQVRWWLVDFRTDKEKLKFIRFSGKRHQLGTHSNWAANRGMWTVWSISWEVKGRKLRIRHEHQLAVQQLRLLVPRKMLLLKSKNGFYI